MKKIFFILTLTTAIQFFSMAADVADNLLVHIKNDDAGAILEITNSSTVEELSAVSRTGLTALHFAAIQNHAVAANELLRKGVPVDVRAPKKNNTTPLHWAALQESIDVIRLLAKNGAALDAKADNGWTPVHFATRAGKLLSVANLIRLGANVNATDNSGNMPIHLAAAANDLKMVALLIKLDANKNVANGSGKLPINMATDQAVIDALKNVEQKIAEPAPVEIKTHSPKAKPTPVKEEIAAPKAAQPAPEVEVSVATTSVAPKVETAPIVEAEVQQEKTITPFTDETIQDIQKGKITQQITLKQQIQALIDDPKTERLANGAYYRGSYKFGYFDGVGSLYSPDGTLYEGEFVRGTRSGVGTFTYNNGDVYSGAWERNVPHGTGVFKFANGSYVSGRWERGILVRGEGIYVDSQYNRYRATWENNKVIAQEQE